MFSKKKDLSDQSNNGEVDNKRTHRLGKPKQNKSKPRPIIIKFVRHNFRWRIFLNKKKLKNSGIFITEILTTKHMKLLNNAKEQFVFRNISKLDGRIYYLAEGSTESRTFRNWVKVACLGHGKNLWHGFTFWVCIFIVTFSRGNCCRKQLFTSTFIIIFSCNGTAHLIFCFDLSSAKMFSTYFFFFLRRLHCIFNNFYFTFNFKRRIIVYYFWLKQYCNNASIVNSRVCFIRNNVMYLQSSKKRSKLIEYLKHKSKSFRVLFLMMKMPEMIIWNAKSVFHIVHPTTAVF